MKNAKIFLASTILGLLLIASSCKKNYLDKNPLDQISSATFWKTESDVKMALTGVYARLNSGFLGWNRYYLEGMTDNAFANWGYYSMSDITLGNLSAATGGVVTTFFGSSYNGISSCNYFMGNIDKVSDLADSKKNTYKGEVRFLRALMYFDLVNAFGGVVLYKESPASPEASQVKKSTAAEVLQFIYEDLDFAIANLADQPYAGHAVKGSAMALKTRILLYEKKWADAAALAQQIITAGKFSLSTSYEGIFLTAGQTNNPEIMFSTQYLSPNSYHGNSSGAEIEYGWGSHLCPYPNLANDYECKDGKSIATSPLFDAANPDKNRDPRLGYTIKLPNVQWPMGEPKGAPSPTGYNMQKFVDLSRIPWNYSKSYLSDQDLVHLRYGDVLLMFAEAKNEATGPDESVYSTLDKIRARPGVNMPPVDRAANNTQALLRNYIRHERRIELALEGLRYFDLKRWHIADAVLPKVLNPSGIPLKFEEKYYLLPFPQAELDKNPKLEQNPGY